MYEIAGLDKLIYDKKCRLVWNFVAANEIFILYDYYLFFFEILFLKFRFTNLVKIQNIQSLELFHLYYLYIIFFIYFCPSFFLNLILSKFNKSRLLKYSITGLFIHEIIKLCVRF